MNKKLDWMLYLCCIYIYIYIYRHLQLVSAHHIQFNFGPFVLGSKQSIHKKDGVQNSLCVRACICLSSRERTKWSGRWRKKESDWEWNARKVYKDLYPFSDVHFLLKHKMCTQRTYTHGHISVITETFECLFNWIRGHFFVCYPSWPNILHHNNDHHWWFTNTIINKNIRVSDNLFVAKFQSKVTYDEMKRKQQHVFKISMFLRLNQHLTNKKKKIRVSHISISITFFTHLGQVNHACEGHSGNDYVYLCFFFIFSKVNSRLSEVNKKKKTQK